MARKSKYKETVYGIVLHNSIWLDWVNKINRGAVKIIALKWG